MKNSQPALRPDEKPCLIAVVDTEEEFDWSKPFSREATSVRNMEQIGRLQEVYDRFLLEPVYVIDYPVASQAEGWRPLRDLVEEGRASIGAHLHPWVNPPYLEELSSRNSYAGNLSRELEYSKLAILTEQIERSFGFRPIVYKAGRFGIGPNSLSILSELGYEVDMSVAPPLDCSEDGGPDFSRMGCEPFQDPATKLLVLPATGGFCGWLPGDLVASRRWATTSWRKKLHANSLLNRLGAVQRVWLNPEAFSAARMIAFTKSLLKSGSRFFVVSLHSSVLLPGSTSFAKDERGVREVLKRLSDYLEFFFEEAGGEPWTPQDALERWTRQDAVSRDTLSVR